MVGNEENMFQSLPEYRRIGTDYKFDFFSTWVLPNLWENLVVVEIKR